MSNTTTPSVVAIGELLWDMLPDGRKPGGAPANFIYHVAQNGVRGTAVTAVGDDELGRDLVSILADNDVNVAAQVNDYPTGITAVRLDDGGIPEYDVVKGVAWDHIEFTDEVRGLVRGADAICYGTIAAREAWGTRDTIYRMIDAASPDAIRLFDINIRSGFVNKEVITRFLEGATILKINDEELPIVANLFGLDSPGDDIASRQRVMEALAGMFDLDVTILTAGDAYSIVMGRDETSILPTPKVDVVDTVGAGDSFSGAFLAYLLRFRPHTSARSRSPRSCADGPAPGRNTLRRCGNGDPAVPHPAVPALAGVLAQAGASATHLIFNEEGPIMSQRNIVPRLAASAALGGLLYGYDTAVINGATAVIKEHFHTGDAVLGLAVGSALITGCIGALLSGRIADKVGRVPMMKIAAVCFLVCGIGCAFAPNIEILVAFRVFGGFAAGVASVVAPMYITEISPTRQRGVLGSLQQLGIVLGIFVSLLVNALLVHVSGGAGTMMGPMMTWQWMFLCMCVPALIYGVLAFTIPESPRYLVAQGRMDEAAGVLAKIDDAEIDVNGQLAAIRASLSADRKPSFRDLIGSNGRLKPVVLAAIGFMILNQFTGINVIFYYSNSLWSAVGFSEKDSFTITAITSLINIAATVIGMTIIDRVGRKPMLLAGSVGMVVAQGGLTVLFGTAPMVGGSPVLGPVSGPLALVCANLFVVAFGVTWGTTSWVMLSEMFPNTMRGAGMAVGTATQWLSNFVVTVSFPVLLGINVGLVYGLFAFFAFVSFFFALKCMHETKGVALEDMRA